MKELEEINQKEKTMLFKAPAYVSLLAANDDGKMDDVEKKLAFKFVHTC